MQDGRKSVWSIPYVSVAFFPSLKQNFFAYRSSSRPDCIFEIHQLWQSGFSRVYSNCYCRCSFKPEIIKIGHSSHKMYSNNIVNFQECTTILNACTKKSGNLLKAPRIYCQKCAEKNLKLHIYIYILSKMCWEKSEIIYLSTWKLFLSKFLILSRYQEFCYDRLFFWVAVMDTQNCRVYRYRYKKG